MANRHTLLSELHRLLGSYTREDFLDASRYKGVGIGMRDILLVLANEAHSEASQGSESEHERAMRVSHTPRDPVSADSAEAIAVLILGSEYGVSTARLTQLASILKLPLERRTKDSRVRFANRIARALQALPNSAREAAIERIRRARPNQTRGWLNVIKSSR